MLIYVRYFKDLRMHESKDHQILTLIAEKKILPLFDFEMRDTNQRFITVENLSKCVILVMNTNFKG